jgi:hypothetical protein
MVAIGLSGGMTGTTNGPGHGTRTVTGIKTTGITTGIHEANGITFETETGWVKTG